MDIDKVFQDQLIKITQEAAISVYPHLGKNNKIVADEAATNSMRTNLNKMDIKGNIVIGEGEMDEAPMLFIGEKLGTKKGLEIDIAVDPVEGTNFVAKNLPGGISVLAIAEKGNLFRAPETYMEKLAIGKNIEKGTVDLDYPLEKNLKNLADAKNKKLNDITVCLLNRDRHKEIIDTLDRLKVNKKLISDGDVAGALYVTDNKFKVDMFIGIGGGPEGVLAASALDAAKCFFQGRFIFQDKNEIIRAKEMGINDLHRKYNLNEIISGDTIFSATGITNGDILRGINQYEDTYSSETLITHKSSNTFEIIKKNMETIST